MCPSELMSLGPRFIYHGTLTTICSVTRDACGPSRIQHVAEPFSLEKRHSFPSWLNSRSLSVASFPPLNISRWDPRS